MNVYNKILFQEQKTKTEQYLQHINQSCQKKWWKNTICMLLDTKWQAELCASIANVKSKLAVLLIVFTEQQKNAVQNLQQFCYVNTHGFSIHQFKTMKKWLLAINFIVHKPDCWIIRFSDLSKAENKETPPSIKYSQMLLIKHRIFVALSDRDALFCCSQKVSTGNLRNKTNKNICKYKVDVFTSNRNENTNVLPF